MDPGNAQRTPLWEAHQVLGARMTRFSGWEMPLHYPEGIIHEHLHTRSKVSLFDTCHMGELELNGANVAAFLDQALARSVLDQRVGTCRYNLLVADGGGIVDDLITYRKGDREFLLVVNAGKAGEDAAFLRQCLPPSVKIADLSTDTGKLDLQGPSAGTALAGLGIALTDLPAYFHWKELSLDGERVLVSRTGYTGELGFELYCSMDRVPRLWDALLAQGDVKPAGLGARDTLRLEAGLPLYGHELSLEVNPLEAGFAGASGPALTERVQRMNLVARKRLTGLALQDRRAARQGAIVSQADKTFLGRVSSGSYAPSLGHAVALAYLEGAEEREKGMHVLVEEHERLLDGEVVTTPFYRGGSVRMNLEGVSG